MFISLIFASTFVRSINNFILNLIERAYMNMFSGDVMNNKIFINLYLNGDDMALVINTGISFKCIIIFLLRV